MAFIFFLRAIRIYLAMKSYRELFTYKIGARYIL